VSWPDEIAPPHELDPVYVPVMAVDETEPVPEMSAVQDTKGLSNPPASTEIEN